MIIVYGDKKVEGAIYANPIFYDMPNKSAKTVYTSDAKIKKDYEAIGVEVKSITKPKAK